MGKSSSLWSDDLNYFWAACARRLYAVTISGDDIPYAKVLVTKT
jgi:hypothetical protein